MPPPWKVVAASAAACALAVWLLVDAVTDFPAAKKLKQLPNFGRIVYSRTEAPWPVSDRDVVLRGELEVNPDKGVAISRFWASKSKLKGKVSGVVRMKRLRGFWKLTAISDTRTRVVYQVSADPAGLLPDWVAAMAQKLAEKVKQEGFCPVKLEGLPAADWVLIDAGDVVVHIFRPEVRSFYNLERMWAFGDAPPVAGMA